MSYIENLGKKAPDPNTGSKNFWSFYKRLINNKKILTYLLFYKMVPSYQILKKRPSVSTNFSPVTAKFSK